MAVFESSSPIEKRVLECSNMQTSGIRCEMEQSYKLATLIIRNFYQLKNDVEYFTPIFELEGEVCFTKRRNNHTIKITADDLGTVTASVFYEKVKTSSPFYADEVSCGMYVIVIPSSVVENDQNIMLKEGRLLIHIRCKESNSTPKRTHDCSGRREKKCEERVSRDLNFVHSYPNPEDILLHVEDKVISVPKGLLKCRSDYFKEYPDTTDNNIHLATYYETVSCAVKYLYTGTLPNLDELSEQQICRLLEVSRTLKINSLSSKCLALMNNLIIQGDIESTVSCTDIFSS